MKKIIIYSVLIAILAFPLFTCKGSDDGGGGDGDGNNTITVPVNGVSLSGDIEVSMGKTGSITATVSPGEASNKSVKFTSDPPGIITIPSSGNSGIAITVTPVKAGRATVTVTAGGGEFPEYTDTCEVTVKAATTPGPSISIRESSPLSKQVGDSPVTLHCETYPEEDAESVEWDSEDEDIATVSPAGVVNFLAVGETKVTVTSNISSLSASITVKVSAKSGPAKIPPTGTVSNIRINDDNGLTTVIGDGTAAVPYKITIAAGAPKKLTAEVIPYLVTNNHDVTWSANTPDIVKVTTDGTVSAGISQIGNKGIITATSVDNPDTVVYCEITVDEKVDVANVPNLTASNLTFPTWTGSGSGLAKATPIWIALPVVVDHHGDSYVDKDTGEIKVTLEGPTGKRPSLYEVGCVSSDTKIATVSLVKAEPGSVANEVDVTFKVTAVKKGTATITLIPADKPGSTKEVYVRVISPLVSVEITPSKPSVAKTKKVTLTAKLTPEDADISDDPPTAIANIEWGTDPVSPPKITSIEQSPDHKTLVVTAGPNATVATDNIKATLKVTDIFGNATTPVAKTENITITN